MKKLKILTIILIVLISCLSMLNCKLNSKAEITFHNKCKYIVSLKVETLYMPITDKVDPGADSSISIEWPGKSKLNVSISFWVAGDPDRYGSTVLVIRDGENREVDLEFEKDTEE